MRTEYCPACFHTVSAAGVCPFCGYDGRSDEDRYPLALRPGTVLAGRYIVGRVLGQGGFGVTYLAMDHRDASRVALKEYFPDSLATRKERSSVKPFTGDREEAFFYGKECFLSEAKTLAEFIGCEGVVRVFSYFEENGTAYFTMEYLQGQSLLSYLKTRGGRIGYAETLRIILPVADALVQIHSKGIVHRDVSPDNIFLTSDGRIKLIDFGAARFSVGDRSRSLDIVLKHGYAPAEQYTRRGRQGAFTDVYALAATAYRAITGRTPPDAVDRMSEDTLIAPSVLGVSIPPRAEDALMKALEVNARDRYQTMREFRDDLLAASPDPRGVRTAPEFVPPVSSDHLPPTVPVYGAPAGADSLPPTVPASEPPVEEEPSFVFQPEQEYVATNSQDAETPLPGVDFVIPASYQPSPDAPAAEEEQITDEDYLFPEDGDQQEEKALKRTNKLLVIGAIAAVMLSVIALVVLLITKADSGLKKGADVDLKIGQTWTVKDQWSLTINSVYKTSKRNSFDKYNDDYADVYIIDYTDTNLGFKNDQLGLFFSLSAYAKDSTGATCLSYYFDDLTSPDSLEIGQSITCQQAIAVYNKGGFTLSGTKYSDKEHGMATYHYTFDYTD